MTGIQPLGGNWEAGTPTALTEDPAGWIWMKDRDSQRDRGDRDNKESSKGGRGKLRGQGKEIPKWIRDRLLK